MSKSYCTDLDTIISISSFVQREMSYMYCAQKVMIVSSMFTLVFLYGVVNQRDIPYYSSHECAIIKVEWANCQYNQGSFVFYSRVVVDNGTIASTSLCHDIVGCNTCISQYSVGATRVCSTHDDEIVVAITALSNPVTGLFLLSCLGLLASCTVMFIAANAYYQASA